MTLHLAEDGTIYSDVVTILHESSAGPVTTYHCDPDGLYDLLYGAITKMAMIDTKAEKPDTTTPELWTLQQTMTKLMKVAVKGVLIMYGDNLLTIFFGSKDHPKLPKGADCLDWYMGMFTKIAISYAMKNDVILTGETVETGLVKITHISTRPVAFPAPIGIT